MFVQIMLMILIIPTYLFSQLETAYPIAADTSSAYFSLSVYEMDCESKLEINTGDYTIPLTGVFIKSGSYNGLFIEFKKKISDTDELELAINLPSGDVFNVYHGYNEVNYDVPDVPFSLTEKDFEGIISRRSNKEVKAYIRLQKLTEREENTFSAYDINFAGFKIYVERFSINDKKISMSCKFEGCVSDEEIKNFDKKFKIIGVFNIQDLNLGYIKVD